jgi:hypothetical protein
MLDVLCQRCMINPLHVRRVPGIAPWVIPKAVEEQSHMQPKKANIDKSAKEK